MKTLKSLRRLHNTKIIGDLQHGECRLHGHRIISWDDLCIHISLCGWDTVTTRRRINQALSALGSKASVYHTKGECFLYDPVRKTSVLMDDAYAMYTLENDTYVCPERKEQ